MNPCKKQCVYRPCVPYRPSLHPTHNQCEQPRPPCRPRPENPTLTDILESITTPTETTPVIPTETPIPNPDIHQYTPARSAHPKSETDMINDLTKFSQADNRVSNQSIDGFGKQWTGTEWNKVPFNPNGKTKEQICAFLRPIPGEPNLIRGLKQKFDEVKPFANVNEPTVAEIDNWHTQVILHFRALLGNPTPLKPSARLFIEARWADERKHTKIWDTSYPQGEIGKASGPCWSGTTAVDVAGGHCGDAFFPQNDIAKATAAPPYNDDIITYPELADYTFRWSRSGGNSGVAAWLPWSVKLATIIANWVCNEGTTGHAGPYVGYKGGSTTEGRTEYGISWWYTGGDSTGYKGKFH